MKYLITLKPLTHETTIHSYSVLAELNWRTKTIERWLKIPAANFSGRNSYMRSFSQGICKDGDKLFLSGWNFLIEIKYSSFEIINVFSHRFMSDIHSLDVTRNELFVCSTGIDTLLCFDREDYSLKWFWRIEDSDLERKQAIPTSLSFLKKRGSFVGKVIRKSGFFHLLRLIKVRFEDNEYRATDKTKSAYHAYHMNEVKLNKNKIYLCTKGWNDIKFVRSSIIELDMQTQHADFYASPGSFCGAHDLLFMNGQNKLLVTESGSESVGIMNTVNNSIEHYKLSQNDYFVRGIAPKPDGFLIGFSPDRLRTCGTSYPFIREYDKRLNQIGEDFTIEGFYSDCVGGAIHNLLLVQ
ncbi:conserved hypothetical protein [uncultured Desulfatiglans sp.]|nr:conserved hypothetical protein [uncultured Desulfatiglans sp.]